jgi:branched-chain amino acid transport system permease protein
MHTSGYFRTRHEQDLALVETRLQRASLAVFGLALLAFPFLATPFLLDLADQVLLASIGALSLMLLTGFAGQVSLGHAGLLAAGAFTVGILVRETGAPFWLTLPAAAGVGALLGLVFGLPSLRLRGLYLAVSTLGLHFVVVYLGGEYETERGFSTGIVIDPPTIAGWSIAGGKAWFFVLLAFSAASVLFSLNLLRSRTGRAWRALREREAVAGILGVDVARCKLAAFIVSSTMTALAGALFAYFRGFVSIEAFSLFLTIQYVAMVIIGGMGSIPGALLGAGFVVLFPYVIEAAAAALLPARVTGLVFALDYAGFGLAMILFLLFEPQGLIGIWRRIQSYFLLWPFKQTPVGGGSA